jgi:hypothetical protein
MDLSALSEGQFATCHSSQGLDDDHALARLAARFERLDGVPGKDADTLLTHNSPGVVLDIQEMYRRTGLGLTRSKDCVPRPSSCATPYDSKRFSTLARHSRVPKEHCN